jgi:DNA-binding FadR family transcriptional regulator
MPVHIASGLRRRLSSGTFPVGTKFLGTNQVAVHFGAHNDEVHEAVIALEPEGRVATCSRSTASYCQSTPNCTKSISAWE